MTTTNPTAAPSAPPPIKIYPAHQQLLRPCRRFEETLSHIGNRLILLAFPFTSPGRERTDFTVEEVDAIGMEILSLQDLVLLAEQQYEAEKTA